ncbi:MAG: SH3 domain-containing protein [Desulfomonilaceae bacterium]
MVLHLTVAALQFAALAALLILWRFWVKRKLQVSGCSDDANHALLPFRRMCRLLLGVVFLSCLVQIYFLWASSATHERIASATAPGIKQEQNIRAINELKGMIEKLTKETASNSRLLRAMKSEQGWRVQGGLQNQDGRRFPTGGLLEGQARLNSQSGRAGSDEGGFAKEAKASSATSGYKALNKRLETRADSSEQIYSMRLNRQGHVATEKLRVRKRPQQDSEVVEKLLDGQQVKVTEKRLLKDTMWFRVITPSGRAGWVDFRYLALDGGA